MIVFILKYENVFPDRNFRQFDKGMAEMLTLTFSDSYVIDDISFHNCCLLNLMLIQRLDF